MTYWEHPLLVSDKTFDEVWSRPGDEPILFIVGAGFDPRAAVVLSRLVDSTDRRIDGVMIVLPEDATDLEVRPMAKLNRMRIQELITKAGGELRHQALPKVHDPGAVGRLVSREFQRSGLLEQYSEVIVEISAMPRSVFFPLVRGILERAHATAGDDQLWAGDLHVAVCENPETDAIILEEGTTPTAPIGGFARTGGEVPATTIWVPVLGEGAVIRSRRLYEELDPDEVCPVLPFPARDPRRGDRIVSEYRQLLFDEIRMEPRNVIYGAERNPFDLYRTLGRLHKRYRQALSPLGSVAMVLSSHSSKLLSVGVLLTAYEHELEVQHVSPGAYGLRDAGDGLRDHDEIFDLWLTGEPYR